MTRDYPLVQALRHSIRMLDALARAEKEKSDITRMFAHLKTPGLVGRKTGWIVVRIHQET